MLGILENHKVLASRKALHCCMGCPRILSISGLCSSSYTRLFTNPLKKHILFKVSCNILGTQEPKK